MQLIDVVNQWFKKAHDDLKIAFHIFNSMHPKPADTTCFLSQQAAEKALKAFLLYNDVEAPYTHDLSELCKACIKINPAFAEYYRDCAPLTRYAVRTRYPEPDEVCEETAAEALRKAVRVYQFIFDIIPGIDEKYRFDKTTR